LQTPVHCAAPEPGCSWFEKCKENIIEMPDDEVCFDYNIFNFLTPLSTVTGKLVFAQIIKKLRTIYGSSKVYMIL
jgi:hypothetical protein